jgi:hypothetical protein
MLKTLSGLVLLKYRKRGTDSWKRRLDRRERQTIDYTKEFGLCLLGQYFSHCGLLIIYIKTT